MSRNLDKPSDELNLDGLSECEIVFRIEELRKRGMAHPLGEDWDINLLRWRHIQYLRDSFKVIYNLEYRDNMIAEYWLLHKD